MERSYTLMYKSNNFASDSSTLLFSFSTHGSSTKNKFKIKEVQSSSTSAIHFSVCVASGSSQITTADTIRVAGKHFAALFSSSPFQCHCTVRCPISILYLIFSICLVQTLLRLGIPKRRNPSRGSH
uniref:Uncharacterized protein n=1 Tax=Arundo donax TaxID=35708 RepID=A0A0A9GX42_ARUDO